MHRSSMPSLSTAPELHMLTIWEFGTLTGALPFVTAPAGDWRRAILSGSFKSLSEHFDDVPERWQSFFTRCFAENRIKRPRSAAEFFRQLEQAFS